MKTLSEKLRVTIIAAISLAITLITIIFFSTSTSARSSELDINHDQLLNQRIKLEKSLNSLKTDLASLRHKNVDLDKCIFEAKQQIIDKEAEIQALLAGKADSATLTVKIAELEAAMQSADFWSDKAGQQSWNLYFPKINGCIPNAGLQKRFMKQV